MFSRILTLKDSESDSVFLWGARQTGKSTLLRTLFPNARYYDLLKSDEFERLRRRPALFREELLAVDLKELVIVDEIQKLPELLDEVHWLITNRGMRFILSGSSARKLKRSGVNLLGGRAVRDILFPLVSAEIPNFNLFRAINNGMIPRHYLVEKPTRRLQAYIGEYLQQEIISEALTRNLAVFTRFLEVAAFSNGEIVNYTNIATECGVSVPTIKEYFSILEETLIGWYLPAWTKRIKRRIQISPKFYFFDVGVANYLMRREQLVPGSHEFGKAFEHFILQEIVAYLGYSQSNKKLSFWRTNTGLEVDAIIGDGEVAIEIKSSSEFLPRHTHGLKAFKEEVPSARLIAVSLDLAERISCGVEVIPADVFLKKLWNGEICSK